jgi:hypothetical protein
MYATSREGPEGAGFGWVSVTGEWKLFKCSPAGDVSGSGPGIGLAGDGYQWFRMTLAGS